MKIEYNNKKKYVPKKKSDICHICGSKFYISKEIRKYIYDLPCYEFVERCPKCE